MAAVLAAMSISVSYSQTTSKASPTDKGLATAVNRHYNTLKSLRVNFVQSYDGLGMQRKESGSLILKKPGRMRWNYSQPVGKLFLLDGRYAYFYAPGQAQATRMPAKELDDLRSPLRFLLGHTQLEKELDDLTITPAGDSRYLLSGIPKGMEKRISRLALEVSADGIIHAMKIEEQDGAITQFSFSEEEDNIPASDQEFVFTPPSGVKIIDGTPPV
jgi:outer membrane lipoprotein carrier protein